MFPLAALMSDSTIVNTSVISYLLKSIYNKPATFSIGIAKGKTTYTQPSYILYFQIILQPLSADKDLCHTTNKKKTTNLCQYISLQ